MGVHLQATQTPGVWSPDLCEECWAQLGLLPVEFRISTEQPDS